MPYGSKEIARAAIKIALSETRQEEKEIKEHFASLNIKTAAVDFGGEFIQSVNKIIEHVVVASKREGIIQDSHAEQGAVAGAAHEAMSQLMTKALGLNVGGKIGIARSEDHITVCFFSAIGLIHLNEISIGLGHRAI